MDAEPGAPAVYSEYVTSLLDSEQAQTATIQSRGAGVITACGTLVALVAALAALANGRDASALTGVARLFVLLAVAAFLLAAMAAIAAYAPRLQATVDTDAALVHMRRHWAASRDAALAQVTSDRMQALGRQQRGNDRRGLMLLVAVGIQVVGVVFLALAVATTLL